MSTLDATEVTAADFNGASFDGPPFDPYSDWIKDAFATGQLMLHPSDTDYAMWLVNGRKTGPGDWIVRTPDGKVWSFGETDWSDY